MLTELVENGQNLPVYYDVMPTIVKNCPDFQKAFRLSGEKGLWENCEGEVIFGDSDGVEYTIRCPLKAKGQLCGENGQFYIRARAIKAELAVCIREIK